MATHPISPGAKKRSSSLKKPHRRLLENTELEDMRPRTTSLPTRNEINRPGRKYLSPISDQEYRSRTSSSVSNGSVCNQSPVMPGSPLHGPPPLCGGEPHYRVTVLGCGGVGRRSLTQQFTTSQYLGGFDSPFSQGCDGELLVSVSLDGVETALEFLIPQDNLDLHSVPASDVFVHVFTIDDRSTFERTTDLLYELRKIDGWAGPVILVANKCDLVRTRDVSTEEAKSVAATYDCKYIETSVVLNHNVDELLAGVVSQIRLSDHAPNKGHNSEQSCYARSKHLLHKIFRKDHVSKSCENLYVL